MTLGKQIVDLYRCECGNEWEEEPPAQCPDCGDEPHLVGRQFTQLGPCASCDDTQLVASKRGPLPCPDCVPAEDPR